MELRKPSDFVKWIWAAPAVVLAVAVLLLWGSRKTLREQLKHSQEVAAQLEGEKEWTQGLLDVLASPDTITVKLAGTRNTPGGRGVAHYHASSGRVFYTAVLPALPAGKTYQMWLVPKEGHPVSAGVFSSGKPELEKVWAAQVPRNFLAKEFEVTVEPAGGMQLPSGETVLLGAL